MYLKTSQVYFGEILTCFAAKSGDKNPIKNQRNRKKNEKKERGNRRTKRAKFAETAVSLVLITSGILRLKTR